MSWTIDKIRSGGHDVIVLAPSAEASRDVLRREGFKDADTLARFLGSEAMQNRTRGQVIWVDEAGLIGSKTMSQLFRTADNLGARVILGGDQRQHRSVERGDAFRLLIQKAGLKTTELTEIMRQKGAYRNVAVDLSEGRVREAWRGMEELKAIEQLTPREAYEKAAKDYVAARRSRRDCLVVSPTHAERRSVTEKIREGLKDAGFLKRKTHDVRQLISTDWTEAQRKDAARYEPGLVVQIHRAIGPFKPGERVEVLGTTDSGIRVADADRRRYDMIIPFARARHFSVYTPSTLELAGGDRVRITVNGVDAEGTHALHNGSIQEVRSVGRDGSVKLKNGLTLAPDFGHLDHGYVLTSHKSQGKTVDEVLIVQTSRSHGATSAEQLYVSVTRARDRFKIYTDDKDALRELSLRGTEREAAVDVFDTARTRERDRREKEPANEHEHERERLRRRDDYEHDR
jgi:ATP-dependent exoDNAse (exonuclease V) alpha subunit